jgi:hypothetical protein
MSDVAIKPFDRRKLFLRLSIASLALAGLLAAGGVFIGGEAWKASSTAGLVFLLNLLVLISFVSPHKKLRFAQWIAIPIIGLLSAIFIWWESDYGNGDYVGDTWVYTRTDYEMFRDWSMGLWWVVVALAILSFFSKTWPLIKEAAFLRYSYIFTFSTALLAAVIAWVNIGIDGMETQDLVLVESVLVILAVTGASIVIISAFVERSRLKSEAAEESIAPIQPEKLEELIDSRIEAFLVNPANRSKILDLLKPEEEN